VLQGVVADHLLLSGRACTWMASTVAVAAGAAAAATARECAALHAIPNATLHKDEAVAAVTVACYKANLT